MKKECEGVVFEFDMGVEVKILSIVSYNIH